MSTAVTDSDREEVLGELEAYYTDKLAAVAAKRGHAKPTQSREFAVDGTVHVRIDPSRKQLVVSWGQ
jgi:hypothetical protein